MRGVCLATLLQCSLDSCFGNVFWFVLVLGVSVGCPIDLLLRSVVWPRLLGCSDFLDGLILVCAVLLVVQVGRLLSSSA